MLSIHPNAHSTPAMRVEIAARSSAPARWQAASACPPGLSARGASAGRPTARTAPRVLTSCRGRRARKSAPSACALRRATGVRLDDLTFVVSHALPHLHRDAVRRIPKADGLNRLLPSEQVRKPRGAFKDYEVGFIHVEVKAPA